MSTRRRTVRPKWACLGTDLSFLDTAAIKLETNVTLYNAFQWRAVLSIEAGCGLCKGALIINETLPPQTLLCRESCVKLTYPAPNGPIPWNAQLGFDVINTSGFQHPPRLNPQVVGALLIRVALMEDPEAASQRLRSLEQWLGKLRQFTAESWATKAWNLDPNEPMQPLGIEVRDLLPREKTCGPRLCWEDMRVPVGAIDFRFVDRCESPTPLEEIDLQLPEEKPCIVLWTRVCTFLSMSQAKHKV